MEGGDVWNPSAPELLQQRMRRLNYVCCRRIAILTREADCEFAAAAEAATAAITLAEAAEVGELSPDDSEDDIIWQDDSVWLEGYHMPVITMHPPIQQPLPRFIPGRGFAQYLARPALCAHAPLYVPPSLMPLLHRAPSRPACSFEHPDHVSPLERVLSEEIFLQFFP